MRLRVALRPVLRGTPVNRMSRWFHCGLAFALLGVAAPGQKSERPPGGGGKRVTIVGRLVDAACFAADGEVDPADRAECGAACMTSGIPAGLLRADADAAGTFVILLTNPRLLSGIAGQTVKVEGWEYPPSIGIDVDRLIVSARGTWRQVELEDARHDVKGLKREKEGAIGSGLGVRRRQQEVQ